MKEVLKYETDDGIIFDSFQDAKKHEMKIEFARYCGNTKDRLCGNDSECHWVDSMELAEWILNHQLEIKRFLGL